MSFNIDASPVFQFIMIHLALKPIFPIELPLDCISASKMERSCIIILYGMCSLDSMKTFIFMQLLAASSEAHSIFSLFQSTDALNSCPLQTILLFGMIAFPIFSAIFLKYQSMKIQEVACLGYRIEDEPKNDD